MGPLADYMHILGHDMRKTTPDDALEYHRLAGRELFYPYGLGLRMIRRLREAMSLRTHKGAYHADTAKVA